MKQGTENKNNIKCNFFVLSRFAGKLAVGRCITFTILFTLYYRCDKHNS